MTAISQECPSSVHRKYLDHWCPSYVGPDTVRSYRQRGYSLALFCTNAGCDRIVEWTSPEPAERFAGKVGEGIADIAAG